MLPGDQAVVQQETAPAHLGWLHYHLGRGLGRDETVVAWERCVMVFAREELGYGGRFCCRFPAWLPNQTWRSYRGA